MHKDKPKTRKLDPAKTCRVCLSDRVTVRDIFTTKIPKLLENIANVEVKEGDNLPVKVCVTCFNQVARFYTLKRKIERNDRILRNNFKALTSDRNILHLAITQAQIDSALQSDDESQPEADLKPKQKPAITIIADPPPLIPIASSKKSEVGENQPLDLNNEPPPPLILLKPIQVPLKKSPVSTPAWKCNICSKPFLDQKRLIGHLKGHMVARHHSCKICGKSYPNPSTFRVHMRTHTGERPFKCHVCGKGFSRLSGVAGHMRTHQADKPFQCAICGKCFKMASNLDRHKVIHGNNLPFGCTYCGKRFSQRNNLKLHVRTYHTGERPYLCSECGKGFVSVTRLNRHMWIHSGYKPHVCGTCGKKYSNVEDLRNHEKNHFETTIDDFQQFCGVCTVKCKEGCKCNVQNEVSVETIEY